VIGELVANGTVRFWRDSVLELARAHASGEQKIPGLPEKLKVTERKMVMKELTEAEKNGTLREVFGTGTAAIVSPVDKWGRDAYDLSNQLLTRRIGYEGRDIVIPTGPAGLGPIAKGVLDTIVGIQTGEIEHEWSVVANEPKTA
jgi:branched-chain amino acid aminotransferase